MRAWLAAFPWWSVLAVQGACLIGSAWWTWKEARRLDGAAGETIDSRAELKSAETVTSLVVFAICIAHMLLPPPWPGRIAGTVLTLAACGVVALLFVPVRRRASRAEASDSEIVKGMLTDAAVTGGLFGSVLLSVVILTAAAFWAVTSRLLSPHWASLLVVAGVCASYGTALGLWAMLSPRLLVGDGEDEVADGILFDMTAAAFRRAGLPAPRIYLVDGSLFGTHAVAYSGLPRGPVKPLLMVEARLLPEMTVAELSAALRHEAAHAAKNHIALQTFWQWLILAVPASCAWLAGAAAARFAPGYEFVAPLPAFLAAVLPMFLFSMRLSRRQEMDADADAVLLYGAELHAMLSVVGLLDALNAALEKPNFWEPRTHPHLAERTAELRRRVGLSAK
jgi:Zn-dependent protease with chaperone function